MRYTRKGFTLIEMLLVLIIVAMLAGVLFRTYSTISEITFRLQQEKYLMQDSLLLSQIFQNAADTSQIDYGRYGSTLTASSGLTDILYLKNKDTSYAFYTTGDCVGLSGEITGFSFAQQANPCRLLMQYSGQTFVVLSDTGHTIVSKAWFKIIPFEDPQKQLTSTTISNKPLFLTLQQPGFWLFMHAYSPRFGQDWIRHVSLPLQQFFTLKP